MDRAYNCSIILVRLSAATALKHMLLYMFCAQICGCDLPIAPTICCIFSYHVSYHLKFQLTLVTTSFSSASNKQPVFGGLKPGFGPGRAASSWQGHAERQTTVHTHTSVSLKS